MKKVLLSIACLLFCIFANAQTTVTYGTGTTTVISGTNITYTGGGSFTNDGTFTMTTPPDVMTIDGGSGFTFAGTGTTDLYNFTVTNSGSATFTSSVTVHGTVTVDAGSSLDAGGVLVLAPGANLVVNGLISNTAVGLVTNASVTTGGCPSYTSVLSTNISGSVIVYQWESSANNVTYTPISGATTATYTATVNPTADKYYHVVITTTNNAYTQTTPNVQLFFTGAVPASITGTPTVCQGLTTALTDATAGGVWSTSATAIAGVGTNGVVTGNSAGTASITYSTGCLPDAVQTVTVYPVPSAIGGTATMCAGLTTTLTDASAFGAWTTTTSSVATVGSSTGVVTGVSAGTSTISYTFLTGCAATKIVTVNPLPAAITGNTVVCASGGTTTLSDATGSGSWTTSTSSVATVNSSTGVVTGVAAGTTTITYTLPTSCINTAVVTVNALPTVSGGSNVAICNGNNTTLTASGAVLYTWSPSTGLSATTGASVTANPTSSTTYTVTGTQASTNTFNYSGSIVSYTVPAGVTSLNISASGAQGGNSTTPSRSGGLGADMSGIFSVTPGHVLNILVGGQPGSVQSNAGGGGGSFVWDVTASNTLLIAAGGGGGASGVTVPLSGTNGIDASTSTSGVAGGGGGGVGAGTSGNGATNPANSFWGGGGAGWLSNGNGGTSGGCPRQATGGLTPLNGGNGGSDGGTNTPGSNGFGGFGGGGGGQGLCGYTGGSGGGGGYSGGAAGAVSGAVAGQPGGGGGSYVSGTLISSGVAHTGNGVVTIVTTGCSNTAQVTVTVNPVPSAIAGPNSVCETANITLSDATSFGAWSTSTSSVATVGAGSGIVSGVLAGTTTISYTLATGCFATKVVTVNPQPGAINGTTSVCAGFTTGLSDAIGGGAWTTSNSTVAAVNSSGLVTANTAGTATISYTLPGGCFSTAVVNVNPVPAAITGTPVVCTGGSTTLSDATGFGQWTSSNTNISITLTTGIMTGNVAGTATISYSLATGCYRTVTGTVNPLPSTITGTPTVCVGQTTALTDAGGGTWTSSNTNTSVVLATGVVTGNVAGSSTITYTLATGCNTTTGVTVNPLPTAILGTPVVCVGLTTTLSDATPSGIWSSSNTSASINSSTGLMTGLVAGNPTISYTLTATGCYVTATGTVNPLPAAISGTTSVCIGLTTGLSDASGGGTWSASNTNISINSSTGLVTGVTAGTTTVTYTLPTSCINTTVVTVNPLPTAILGTPVVCVGLSTTLSDATSGGTWSSSNTSASIGSGTGVMTGVTAGNPTISYTLTATGCYTTVTGTVNPLPAAISGTLNVCVGLTTGLSNATSGGTWSTSNTNASINSSTGAALGVNAGTTTVTYTLPTGCIMTAVLTVNPLPAAISGTANACPGTSTTLTDATAFGAWSISAGGVASIGSSTGIVTGATAGTATVTYSLPTGCIATRTFTVNPLPAAITSGVALCATNTVTLTDASSGGTWASNTTSVATIVSGTGVLTGVAAGTTTVTYTLPTGCLVTTIVTVNALPTISGGSNVAICNGSSYTLNPSGGVLYSWSPASGLSCTNCTNPVATPTVTTTYTVTGANLGATTTFSYSGSIVAYTVPAGVTSLYVSATGAQGGNMTNGSFGSGGLGANMTGSIAVTPGNVLNILVGQQPVSAMLTGGGGGGSFVWDVTAGNTLLVAAGGGGGAGYDATTGNGFAGIDAVTTNNGTGGTGGYNGGGINGNGGTVPSGTPFGLYGAGGTGWFSNGAGGVGACSNATGGSTPLTGGAGGIFGGSAGVNGSGGFGGGGGSQGVCSFVGGGGGGGYSGGGGGVFDNFGNYAYAGGGGGSYISGTLISSSVANTGNGTVSISLPGCINTATVTVTVNPVPAPISGANNVCTGLTTTLTNAVGGGVWTSNTPSVATIGSTTGVVSGITTGTTTISYSLSTGCLVTKTFTVSPLPSSISGSAVACVGLTATLTDATPGGTWSSSNTSLATIVSGTGVMTGVLAGNPTITYTTTDGCIATTTATVNALPAAITGTTNVCVGLTTNLTDATPGGAWTSSNTNVTVVSGAVTGVAAGTSTITYTLPTGCINTTVVTVNPLPVAISGTPVVCVGLTTTLTDASAGGTWASSNLSVATIGTSSGLVTGIGAGTATVTYTLPTGCTVLTAATVNPLPAAITGTNNVCIGLTTALTNTATGGTWSTSNTNASINSSTGLVTGVAAGTTTVTYTLPTGCIMTYVVTVNPLPNNITGTLIVCSGATTTLASTTPSGAWTSGTSAVATVNSSTGVVSGVSPGTSSLTYTLSTGCLTTTVVTVIPTPVAITASTVFNVCVGSAIFLNDASGFGNWSSSNTALAIVGSGTGIVTGVAAGTPTITYSFANGCFATTSVTVNALPAAITGTMSSCIGATSGLANVTPSGTWSSSATTIATVNSGTGVVTGVAAGTTTITYTLPTGCIATSVFTVNPFPSAITGTMSVCPGATTPLADPTTSGNWSSSTPSVATVGSGTGIVTGVAAGTTTVTYTLSTGCNATTIVTVNPLPSAITGITNVCAGLTTALSDAGGGTWVSSNTTAATVNITTGVVSGLAAGTTTITYTLPTTGCQTTTAVTVNPLPSAITGNTQVCVGLTTALTDAGGGTWTSSNTNASVVLGTGVVTGNAAGTSTITYTLPTGCINTTVVTVNPLPTAITGTTNVCIGLTTNLADATLFGAWSSSTTAVATVGASSGIVSGISAGTTLITYALSTGCQTTTQVTVNPLPVAITGSATVCAGLTTTFSDATPLGTWSSSNTTAATVNSATGVVSGLAAGTSTITYTLPTGCINTKVITVNPLPANITGTLAVCSGLTTTLSDATPSGTWSSSDVTMAAINSSTGVVNGLLAGTPTITYMLSTGCIATAFVTVNPLPANITGTTNVCAGLTTTLSDATPSGTWSSSNTTVATMTGNVVNGLVAGTTTVTYTLPTGCIMTTVVTVNPLPAAITGTTNVCASGATTALADATPFGIWSSSNLTAATVVSSTGVVTGVNAGTTTITYTLPTGCITTTTVLVNPLPAAITGTFTVCEGLTTILSDATAAGTWSSSNTTAATVPSGTGLVTGLVAGTTTISYTLPTGCRTTQTVTVNPLPGVIGGPSAVCAGLTITVSDATPLGTWSSSTSSVATINSASGLLNGLVAGTTTITYALTATGCIMTKVITVNPLPGAITGTANVCVGLTTALADAGGGTWTNSNLSVATVGTSSGIVTGIAAGTTTVTYTLGTGCQITTAVTVNPLPSAITGTMQVCAGLTTALTDAGGGTWTSSNTAVATVNGSGVVNGLVAGTTTITYTLPTGCINTAVVTVNPLPATIAGSNNVCFGLTTVVTDPTPFGQWSSSNPAVASIGSATGLISGNTVGSATITYTISTGCITTMAFTVNPLPTAILGTPVVCAGLTTTLTDATPLGSWSSSNLSVASIGSATGVMLGVAAGTTTITYTLPTGCIITRSATVNPLPAAITGATTSVCAGLTIAVSDATPSGTWSVSNTNASVNSSTGVVTGNVAGTTTLTYTLPTGCIMTTIITVNPLPAAITGTMSVCAGLTTTLSDATPSGTWSSSNTAVATVAANVVTGVLAGTATITYTLPTGCIMTSVVTVNPLPATITGTTNVCAGLTTTLSDATPSGTWSSSNTTVATINSGTGLVNGLVAGTATMTYTIPTGCIMTTTLTVNPLPAAITGTTDVCAGLTTTLSDATPSGTWSSSNTSFATVGSTTGVVTGVAAGNPTITYTLPTGCIMTSTFTVNPLPAAITGTMDVCEGLTTTLSDATPSGTWSSSNTAVATVAGNVVTGVLAGTATITYTLPTGCIMTTTVLVNPLPQPITGNMNVCAGLTTALSDAGGGTWSNDLSPLVTALTINSATGVVTAITAGTNTITYTLPTGCLITTVVTVDPLPAAITGAATHVCEGLTIAMSDATPLGTWSVSNANASVNSLTGVVTGNTAGSSILTYMLPTGCIMTTVITVDPLPTAITGTLNVCAGLTTALSNGSTGGSWSIGSSTIATVNATSGVITGVMAGTTMVTYTLPTGCIMTAVVTVDPLPSAITGTMQVCAGLTTTLSNGSAGGSWSIGSSTIATVNPTSGVVTGVSAGTATVTYTLPTGCIMTAEVTVNPLPSAITGHMNVCPGSTTTLTDVGGGSWSSSNGGVATVTAGVVTGIMSGTTTITYTLPTGCITTTMVTVDTVPTVFAVTGGGSYCVAGSGVHVLLSGSTVGVNYQLYNGATPIGSSPTAGTGFGLDFGLLTGVGTYSVVATSTGTTCSSNMLNAVNIDTISLPTAYTVTGGGSYCAFGAGIHVGLSNSDAGTEYQLYKGGIALGLPVVSTGGAIDFGMFTVADTYTVAAHNPLTTCNSMMTGKATVTINPLLTPSVSISYASSADTICAGTPVTYTATSVNGGTAPAYEWKVNGVAMGTTNTFTYTPGLGDIVKVVLTSNAICPVPDTAADAVIMSIIPLSLPTVAITSDHVSDTVCKGTEVTYTASGTFGGSAPLFTWVVNGVTVGAGTSYTYTPNDSDVVYSTLLSNYRCRSVNRVFSNNIVMGVQDAIVPSVSIAANPGNSIAAGTTVTLTATITDGGNAPTYKWFVNGAAITGATSSTYANNNFANKDSVTVFVTRTDACGMSSFNGLLMHVGGVSVIQVAAGIANINVVPNPNKGEFTVKGDLGVTADVEVTMELTNMLGQVVYKGNTVAKGGTLDEHIKLANTLANGMYLLNVHSDAASKVFHIVIEQ